MLAIYRLEIVRAGKESALKQGTSRIGLAPSNRMSWVEEQGRNHARVTGRAEGDCVVYRDIIIDRKQERPDFNRMMLDIAEGKIDEVWAVRLGALLLSAGEKRTFDSLCLAKSVKVSLLYDEQVQSLRCLQKCSDDARGNEAMLALSERLLGHPPGNKAMLALCERLLGQPWIGMLIVVGVSSGHLLDFRYEFSDTFGHINTAKWITDSNLYDCLHKEGSEYYEKRGLTLDQLLTEIEAWARKYGD